MVQQVVRCIEHAGRTGATGGTESQWLQVIGETREKLGLRVFKTSSLDKSGAVPRMTSISLPPKNGSN